MDRQRMHRLGKQLIALARQVDLEAHDVMPSAAEHLVLSDVALYPRSTIGELVDRIGFTQGYVSKCVATLAAQGLLVTSVDPADRRRTVVEPSPGLVRAVERRTLGVDDLLAGAVSDPRDALRARALLDELSDLLLP